MCFLNSGVKGPSQCRKITQPTNLSHKAWWRPPHVLPCSTLNSGRCRDQRRAWKRFQDRRLDSHEHAGSAARDGCLWATWWRGVAPRGRGISWWGHCPVWSPLWTLETPPGLALLQWKRQDTMNCLQILIKQYKKWRSNPTITRSWDAKLCILLWLFRAYVIPQFVQPWKRGTAEVIHPWPSLLCRSTRSDLMSNGWYVWATNKGVQKKKETIQNCIIFV